MGTGEAVLDQWGKSCPGERAVPQRGSPCDHRCRDWTQIVLMEEHLRLQSPQELKRQEGFGPGSFRGIIKAG